MLMTEISNNIRAAAQQAGIPAAGPGLMLLLDLDGTVLPDDGVIRQRVREAVHAHVDAGTHVVIATGRGRMSAHPVAEMLGLDSAVMICSNGNETVLTGGATINGVEGRAYEAVTDGGQKVSMRLANITTIEPAALENALHQMHKAFPDAYFAVEPAFGERMLADGFPFTLLHPQRGVHVPYEELFIDDCIRMFMVAPGLRPQELQDRVDRLNLYGLEVIASSSWDSGWVDAGRAGVTKATAGEVVREEYGFPPHATVAVGDGGNDVDMLRWAGLGVAMGQAADFVQEAADVSTGTIWEDGLAIALETLLEN
ncbi:cof family hydrolase [Actinobaculum suis]|uniref:Cof family hydrolase n=2 Tax=Actinobaculum suis TaxID=1657 RepID=A0A7Z9C7G7_9ACTO|nr:cof family hydrolase [Actinobaculum suis]